MLDEQNQFHYFLFNFNLLNRSITGWRYQFPNSNEERKKKKMFVQMKENQIIVLSSSEGKKSFLEILINYWEHLDYNEIQSPCHSRERLHIDNYFNVISNNSKSPVSSQTLNSFNRNWEFWIYSVWENRNKKKMKITEPVAHVAIWPIQVVVMLCPMISYGFTILNSLCSQFNIMY